LSKRDYYVYAYRIDGDMAYVGKGTGNLAWLKRQMRSIMRMLEAEDPSLI